MTDLWQWLPFLLFLGVIGSFAGFLSGLLGIGGGLVLVPCFFYGFQLLGYDPAVLMHIAVGTSLATIAPTGLSAARAHWKKGSFDPQIFKKVAPGTFIGAVLGVLIADISSGDVLQFVFAAAVMLVAVIMFTNPARFSLFKELPAALICSFIGIFIGILAALMGIAGALLAVPFLSMCRVPMHTAVGTSAGIGITVSVPAAIGFLVIGLDQDIDIPFVVGYIHVLAWLIIIPFSVMAAPFGAKVAHAISVERLRFVFACFMVIISLRMFYEALYV